MKDHHTFVKHERGWEVENVLEGAEELRVLNIICSSLRVLFLLLKFHFLVFKVKTLVLETGGKKKIMLPFNEPLE